MPFRCRSTLTRKRARSEGRRRNPCRRAFRGGRAPARHDLVDRFAHESAPRRSAASARELAVLADARRVPRHEVQVRAVRFRICARGTCRSSPGAAAIAVPRTAAAGCGRTTCWRTLLVGRVGVGVVRIDFLGLDRVQQRLVHELHAEVLAGLQLAPGSGASGRSWMSFAIARFITMTSQTARRPRPSGRLTSTWLTPRSGSGRGSSWSAHARRSARRR